jgi:putative PIN family toxin of toxin-antitoxin system
VIRAVVDTNVIVSALISPSGNEALILLAVRQGLIKPYFSDAILQEYAEVLARPKFGFPPDEIEALIALVRSQGEEVPDPASLPSGSPDPADAKFLACAKAAEVEFIVTGNKRDFPPQACGSIGVVNAAELLDRITLEI